MSITSVSFLCIPTNRNNFLKNLTWHVSFFCFFWRKYVNPKYAQNLYITQKQLYYVILAFFTYKIFSDMPCHVAMFWNLLKYNHSKSVCHLNWHRLLNSYDDKSKYQLPFERVSCIPEWSIHLECGLVRHAKLQLFPPFSRMEFFYALIYLHSLRITNNHIFPIDYIHYKSQSGKYYKG